MVWGVGVAGYAVHTELSIKVADTPRIPLGAGFI